MFCQKAGRMRLRILGFISAYIGAAAMGSLGVKAKQIRAAFMLVGVDDTNAQIVKVLDLPDVPMLKREDGRYVDLGYKWGTSSDGQWVGYIGSSTSYVPLTKELRATLMMVGALKEMPPAPKRPRSFNYWPLLVFLGLIVAMSKAISAFKIVISEAREKSPDLIDKSSSGTNRLEAAGVAAAAIAPDSEHAAEKNAPDPSGVFAASERQHVSRRHKFGRR
jgi:hypothetical protein